MKTVLFYKEETQFVPDNATEIRFCTTDHSPVLKKFTEYEMPKIYSAKIFSVTHNKKYHYIAIGSEVVSKLIDNLINENEQLRTENRNLKHFIETGFKNATD